MSNLPNGSGASTTLFEHSKPNKPNSSKFDISRIVNLSAEPGAVIPVDVIPCLPGDRHNLSCRFALDTLPLINASLTQYKVTTHWYYLKYRDLWKGWKTFSTKGRSGNVSLTIPRIDLEYGFNHNSEENVFPVYVSPDDPDRTSAGYGRILPQGFHSLASYLGCPSRKSGLPFYTGTSAEAEAYVKETYLPYTYEVKQINNDIHANLAKIQSVNDTSYNTYRYPSALPFMAYQNICKYNYVPQNLLQDCEALFPIQGDDDWLLPYDATITNYVSYSNNSLVPLLADNASYTGVYHSTDNVVRLDCLRYACFDDDYFTTSLPWLQRGTPETLDADVTISGLSGILGFDDDYLIGSLTDARNEEAYSLKADNGSITKLNTPYSGDLYTQTVLHDLGVSFTSYDAVSNASIQLTANKLRQLLALSVWQERNAQVDGSYNRMIYQHWSVNPHSDEHRPVYIGGTSDYVSFSTILQSSESTSNSPLGATAGYGNSKGNGYVGNFYCEDYGLIMGIMIIRPNTTYQQGIEHYLSCENTFEDFPQPEFEGLSPQPILKKELFVSGDDSVDNSLFGYQERYVYLKSRLNVNRGLFLSSPSRDNLFATFTQSRWFTSSPELSYQFLVMSPENIRRDFLAYPNLPVFKIQFETQDYVVRNLSYSSQPNTFGF